VRRDLALPALLLAALVFTVALGQETVPRTRRRLVPNLPGAARVAELICAAQLAERASTWRQAHALPR
jgi:hypothetical protein